jgi:hypothetical protein
MAQFDGYDEFSLLRHYLKKNHGFRHRDPEYTYQLKAIINDGWKYTPAMISEYNAAAAYVIVAIFDITKEISVGEHFRVWLAERTCSREISLKRLAMIRK